VMTDAMLVWLCCESVYFGLMVNVL
jgi:hypothetical protein